MVPSWTVGDESSGEPLTRVMVDPLLHMRLGIHQPRWNFDVYLVVYNVREIDTTGN
jgi:hypothetical protein